MPGEAPQHSGKLLCVLTDIFNCMFLVSDQFVANLTHSISKGNGVTTDHCQAKEAEDQLESGIRWKLDPLHKARSGG